jgi:hypothetical protein
MLILDQHDDGNLAEFVRLSRLYQLPDYVKKAAVSDLIPDETAPANYYADFRGQRRYPIHTKAATYVSTLYFLEKQAAFPPTIRKLIGERLLKAAGFWGITNEAKQAAERHQEIEKQAEYPDSTYALVVVGSDGNKERQYPLRNTLEVKAAADWFVEYLPQLRQEFSFTDRSTIAGNILNKAAELGANIGANKDIIERCACRGTGSPNAIANMLRKRAMLVSHKEVKAVMQKLASSTANTAKIFMDPASMLKLAEVVDQFDRANNLLNRYSPSVPAPEDVIYEVTFNKLAEIKTDSCPTQTGSVYDKEQFSKLAIADVKDLFGDDIADAVCTGLKLDPEKFAAVASTFPRPDAQLLDELMSAKGIKPVLKQAAASGIGFDWQQYKAIAGA